MCCLGFDKKTVSTSGLTAVLKNMKVVRKSTLRTLILVSITLMVVSYEILINSKIRSIINSNHFY
jgi:hypothetical protein